MKLLILSICLLMSCSTQKLKNSEVASNDAEITLVNELIKKIQIINLLVAQKNYEVALVEIKRLTDKFPLNYVFYDMQGSIHFMKGSKAEALKSFEKSLELNPKNKEAKLMIDKTKKQYL